MRIGGLFEGCGGLTMGVQAALGGELAWYSEIDKGALKVLEHRHPGVPNIGDITAVKWTPDCPTCGGATALYNRSDHPDGRGYYCPYDGFFDLSIRFSDPQAHRIPEPVEGLCGGSPCQNLSHAGKRAGMTEGTRSNLWVAMREAIAQLRPGLVIWENVRGAYSACADSDMGRCPRCVDQGSAGGHAPWLRALGRVLGDLSDLGYDAVWHGLRAADVGAPHGRFRVFVVAYPAADSERGGRDGWTPLARRGTVGRTTAQGASEGALLPSPRTSDTNGAGQHGDGGLDLRTAVTMLPTPRATDGTKGGPNQRGSSGDLMLPSAVTHLLPTPVHGEWGQYAVAIARWESLTRPAPAPTELGPKGNPRLSAAFSEWLMGLPAGWVTDVPGITRNEALKALGNGVVPQQAEAALRWMLGWLESVAA